jgi:hypothetical protein
MLLHEDRNVMRPERACKALFSSDDFPTAVNTHMKGKESFGWII